METAIETSRSAAAEDLREGDYVTVTRMAVELVPFLVDECWTTPRVHRVHVTPPWSGYPLRVVKVCLPFVLTRDPKSQSMTLDLRRYQLAKLTEGYGRKAFKCLQRQHEKETKAQS
jgi:hypothetical protein